MAVASQLQMMQSTAFARFGTSPMLQITPLADLGALQMMLVTTSARYGTLQMLQITPFARLGTLERCNLHQLLDLERSNAAKKKYILLDLER